MWYAKRRISFDVTSGKVLPLPLINENEALVLRAKRDFENGVGVAPRGEGKEKIKPHPEDLKVSLKQTINGANISYQPRKAGEMWQMRGPLLYYPVVGVEIVKIAQTIVLGPNQGEFRLLLLPEATIAFLNKTC